MKHDWTRVSREHPCPCCSKPDFCTVAFVPRLVCCMRIESDRPSTNSLGGWIHKLGGDAPCRRVTSPVSNGASEFNPHFAPILAEWRASTNGQIGRLAYDLGVSERSLVDLSCAWAAPHRAFAFPMRDDRNEIVGIRLRNALGRKWAVRGSHQGLFYSMDASQRLDTSTVAICEGPTDTAAALSLGMFAIGRPACRGCEAHVISVLRQIGARDAIVIYDNDGPGVDGAEKLAAMLPFRTTRFVPPVKDLRAFRNSGGTRELLMAMAHNVIRTRR